MKMLCRAALAFLLFPTSLLSQSKEYIGDVNDGNRSTPVHLIRLYDELGHLVVPDENPALPYSEKETCQKCHDYEKIRHGWHFNAADSGIATGRIGEPWILVDPQAATQMPVSYRPWPGTYSPRVAGLSTLQYLSAFGHHLPGGSVGESERGRELDDYMRWQVSGNLDVNCESCHSIDPGQSPSEYALQVLRQNYRWAAAGSSGFAVVLGSAREMPPSFDVYSAVPPERSELLPPTVTYNRARFDVAGRVLFDEVRRIPPEKCYFCHSMNVIDSTRRERWQTGEDVHIAAGMSCVDCHRNGLDHQMVRGYDGEGGVTGKPTSASFTCKGCHLGSGYRVTTGGSNRSAPRPLHLGIPPVHFERMTCTACHSGPWPRERAFRVKTSRAHALGLPVPDRSDDALPHIVAPVFVKESDGRYAPHALFWPAFWGYLQSTGIRPVPPTVMRPLIGEIYREDTARALGRWPMLRPGDVRVILDRLYNLDSTQGPPVYVSAGGMFASAPDGMLEKRDNEAARAFSWPIAHDVRPKGESLGVNGCDDCHSPSSAFYFGSVVISSPFMPQPDSVTSMTSYQNQGSFGPWLFSMSFLFRPLLKILIIGSFVVISTIVFIYLGRAIAAFLQRVDEEQG